MHLGEFYLCPALIQQLHREKKPSIFLKLDIAKAFDSVNWNYLLSVLAQYGFSQRTRDMVAISLASTSSRVILNGAPGTPFFHKKALRQGDPLSPLLFLLAIYPLQKNPRESNGGGNLKPHPSPACKPSH